MYHIWDQVPVDYYQIGTKNNLFQKIWHRKKIKNSFSILRDLKFKNFLDIGCASGYFISEIAKIYPHVKFYGIDIYDKAISYAKTVYHNIDFKVASAEKLPFKNETFDLIINVETIEHVENPEKVLVEIKRVLKKNGTAIITMDSGSLLFRIVWFIWENSTGRVWKGAHLHPFRHDELGRIINAAGFKIKKKIFSNFGMEVTFVFSK